MTARFETEQWQRKYEELEKDRDHWREMYQASFDLNADLINGLEIQKARAWDEGWEAAWTPMSLHHKDQGPNPYRSNE